ncbi:MAG: hypothetical protein HFG34_00355 [Eubacterium sp.]|nr:hypothetical protein [Eubacterium sp.]
MVNKILDGITNALYEEFGSKFFIYTEDRQQGVQEPCFFVSCISNTDERWFGNRRKLENRFAVQYLPGTDEPKRECNEIGSRIMSVLEYIKNATGDLMEGTKFSSELTNGFLTVFVNYDCYTERITQEQRMEKLNVEGGLRDGNRKNS